MARYFHGGGEGMDRGNDPDRPNIVRHPPWFADDRGRVPEQSLKKGGICISLPPYGFWHIGPGEYADLPDDVSPKSVKALAPQLLTKAEALADGLCNEDGSIKIAKAPAPAPPIPAPAPVKK